MMDFLDNFLSYYMGVPQALSPQSLRGKSSPIIRYSMLSEREWRERRDRKIVEINIGLFYVW